MLNKFADRSATKATEALGLFVGRTSEIKTFVRCVEAPPGATIRVLSYYGVGGIGKSFLIEKLVHYTRDRGIPSVRVDFVDPESRSQRQTLFNLRNALWSNHRLRFPRFDLAYAIWWNQTHPVQITPTISLLPDEADALSVILQGLKFVPHINEVVRGIELITSLAKRVPWFMEWWESRGLCTWAARLTNLEPQQLLELLPEAFCEDLQSNVQDVAELQRHRAVLFIDTFDALWSRQEDRFEMRYSAGDSWVRKLCSLSDNLLVVIAGRDKLQWEQIPSASGSHTVVEQCRLDIFSAVDARHFLMSRGIRDYGLRAHLCDITGGHPLFLAMAADIADNIRASRDREPCREDFSDRTVHDIGSVLVSRLLYWLSDEQAELVSALSICRWFDRRVFDVVAASLSIRASESAWKSLLRYSFVQDYSGVAEGYVVHETLRILLLTRLSDQLQSQLHGELAAHHEQRGTEVPYVAGLHHTAEQLYHQLLFDGREGGKLLCRLCLKSRDCSVWDAVPMLINVASEACPDNPVVRLYAQFASAEFLRLQHLYKAASDEYEKCLKIQQSQNESVLLPATLYAMACCSRGMLDLDSDLSFLTRALEAADKGTDSAVKGDILLGLMRSPSKHNTHRADLDLGRAAAELFAKEKDFAQLSFSHLAVSEVLSECGEYEDALVAANEAIRVAEKAEIPLRIISGRYVKGLALTGLCRLEEAEQILRGVISDAIAGKYATYIAIGNRYLGIALQKQGRLSEAIDAYEKALFVEVEYRSVFGVGVTLNELGNCRLLSGNNLDGIKDVLVARNLLKTFGHFQQRRSSEILKELRKTLGQQQFQNLASSVNIGESPYLKLVSGKSERDKPSQTEIAERYAEVYGGA